MRRLSTVSLPDLRMLSCAGRGARAAVETDVGAGGGGRVSSSHLCHVALMVRGATARGGVAKAAEDADAATHEVKKEKVRIQHNLTKTAHSFSILLLTARCVACVRAGRVGRGYGDDGR